MADCPDCGRALAEESPSCGQCGWPHSEATATDADSPAASTPSPTADAGPRWGQLAAGLAVGLIFGFFVGRASVGPAPAGPAPVPSSRVARPAAAGASQRPERIASNDALRLREVSWKMDQAGQCMGIFEVVSAPASLRVLRFSALDGAGKVIASDRVAATKQIRPRTRLELGFRVPSCDTIAKWRVAVGDAAKKPADKPDPASQPASQPATTR